MEKPTYEELQAQVEAFKKIREEFLHAIEVNGTKF